MWPLAKPTRTDAQDPPILQLQKFLGLTGAQDQARARKANQQPFGAPDSRHYLVGGLVGGGILLSCRLLQRHRKRRSADQQRRDSIQAALCAQARAQAALAAHSRHVPPSATTGPTTQSSDQAETSRQPQAAARQASQGSRTSCPTRPIRAPAFMSNPGGSAATEAYDIFHPPQYQPDPDAARPEERRLSAWEDAWVKDPGMESHPARAHLDTGKRIYSRAGLSDQGAQCRWDLVISHNEIQVFEEAGFTFSTRT